MADPHHRLVSTRLHDGRDACPSYDTGWQSAMYGHSGQDGLQARDLCHMNSVNANNGNPFSSSAADQSEFMWTRGLEDPSIDRFDDVPVIQGSHNDYSGSCSAPSSNFDNTVESLNSCPMSDLLNDEVPYANSAQQQTEFHSLERPSSRTVYTNINNNLVVKNEPTTRSFTSSDYGVGGRQTLPPSGSISQPSHFLPNNLMHGNGTYYQSMNETSISALQAAGFLQAPEYMAHQTPTHHRTFDISDRPPPYGGYVQHSAPTAHRQHHTGSSGSVRVATPNSSGGWLFQSAPMPGPVNHSLEVPSTSRGNGSVPSFQSLPALTNNAFQSSEYYNNTQQFRPAPLAYYPQQHPIQQPQPPQVYQQQLQPLRTNRERYLSAPGGTLAQMDQLFGPPVPIAANGFNLQTDLNDRSRSPFSRCSSTNGVGSPWCPSPLPRALQMTSTPSYSTNDLPSAAAASTAVNLFQFAEMGGQSSYFWQYNTQSKQRGQRSHSVQDPYSFHEDFRDPIFASEDNNNNNESEAVEVVSAALPTQQLRHPGKARRGDGTDTTPNPTLLYCIGNLLAQLNNEINGIHAFQQQQEQQEQQVGHQKVKHSSGSSESMLQQPALTTNRREKNMLASRVCRLKRKAQHEANKIVMAGLKHESEQVIRSIAAVEELLRERLLLSPSSSSQQQSGQQLLTEFRAKVAPFSNSIVRCAGRTSEFVADVLQKVSNGDQTGGLQTAVATAHDDGGMDSDNEHFMMTMSKLNAKHGIVQPEQPQPQHVKSRKRHTSSHPRVPSKMGPFAGPLQ